MLLIIAKLDLFDLNEISAIACRAIVIADTHLLSIAVCGAAYTNTSIQIHAKILKNFWPKQRFTSICMTSRNLQY